MLLDCGSRDIKPHNYAMGREPPESRTVYLLDFGLVRRYRVKGCVRQPRLRTAFRGSFFDYYVLDLWDTIQFRNHKVCVVFSYVQTGCGQARRFDQLDLHVWVNTFSRAATYIFSFIVVVEFLKELPWHDESERSRIANMKLTGRNALLDGIPQHIHQIYDLLIPLSVMEHPPYLICKAKLQELACRWECCFELNSFWSEKFQRMPSRRPVWLGKGRETLHSDQTLRNGFATGKQGKDYQTGYTMDLTETTTPE